MIQQHFTFLFLSINRIQSFIQYDVLMISKKMTKQPRAHGDYVVEEKREYLLERFEKRLEIPMILLGVAIIPLIIIEEKSTDANVLVIAWLGNLIIWLAFLCEYLVLLYLSKNKRQYINKKGSLLNLAIIVLAPPIFVPLSMQSLRALRALRITRIARASRVARSLRLMKLTIFAKKIQRGLKAVLSSHGFIYVAAITILLVFVGGLFFSIIEDVSFEDGLYWAIVTVSTVGYGDISPETTSGKMLAAFLIIVGLVFFAGLTANLASFFIEKDMEEEKNTDEKSEKLNEISDRLEKLENMIRNLSDKEQEPMITKNEKKKNEEIVK